MQSKRSSSMLIQSCSVLWIDQEIKLRKEKHKKFQVLLWKWSSLTTLLREGILIYSNWCQIILFSTERCLLAKAFICPTLPEDEMKQLFSRERISRIRKCESDMSRWERCRSPKTLAPNFLEEFGAVSKLGLGFWVSSPGKRLNHAIFCKGSQCVEIVSMSDACYHEVCLLLALKTNATAYLPMSNNLYS